MGEYFTFLAPSDKTIMVAGAPNNYYYLQI